MSYRKVSEMLDAWQLGPFGKHPDNPILGPGRNQELGAENIYNPTAYTDGETVTLLLRAQAEDGTSAICKATSDDGVNFRVDADAVRRSREDRRPVPHGDEEHPAPLLRHAVLLGLQDAVLDGVPESAEAVANLPDRAGHGEQPGDVLDDHGLRHQAPHDPQVVPEKPASLVLHAAFMVVHAERLARRPPDHAVQLPRRQPTQIRRRQILDPGLDERRARVPSAECPGRWLVHVRRRQ